MEKRHLRPWMAVLFVLAFALDIFVVSGFLGLWFGVWGTLLHELLLALLAVLLAALFRADLRRVFPFKWPRASKVAGTLILWLGTFLAAMAVTMLVSYFFPQEVLGAGQGVQDIVVSVPVLLALFLVALTPAVCEEMAFRGGFLGCLRGMKSKWAGILIVAVVFGAFHGSVWRMIPHRYPGRGPGVSSGGDGQPVLQYALSTLSITRCRCCFLGLLSPHAGAGEHRGHRGGADSYVEPSAPFYRGGLYAVRLRSALPHLYWPFI